MNHIYKILNNIKIYLMINFPTNHLIVLGINNFINDDNDLRNKNILIV